MVYNYFVHPGEEFNIKTPNNKTVDVKLKTDGEINITTNMELIKKSDGFYYIKDFS